MEALKAQIEAKRKAKEQEFSGQKFKKRGEIEEARLRQKQLEEEQESAQKALKKVLTHQSSKSSSQEVAESPRVQQDKELERQLKTHSREEIIRRLRLLKQPATLFGEEDIDRLKRLLKAEEEFDIGDEHVGGQQGNIILELEREKKEADAKRRAHEEEQKKKSKEEEEQENMMETFKKAAERLQEKQKEATLTPDERVLKAIQNWLREWEDDLQQRPEEVKRSMVGSQVCLHLSLCACIVGNAFAASVPDLAEPLYPGQASNVYQQTKKFFGPMYKAMKRGDMHPEVRLGIHMMVQVCHLSHCDLAALTLHHLSLRLRLMHPLPLWLFHQYGPII